MLERLRQRQAAAEPADVSTSFGAPKARSSPRFMGMTPSQLFLLSLMVFLNVSVLGFLALVAFDKVRLPF